MEKSKDIWKARAKELKAQRQELSGKIAQMEKKRRKKKWMVKKKDLNVALTGQFENFRKIIPYHHYSIGHITLFIELVLSASASLRCASNAINIIPFSFQHPFSSPSWYTSEKIGLYYYTLFFPTTSKSFLNSF